MIKPMPQSVHLTTGWDYFAGGYREVTEWSVNAFIAHQLQPSKRKRKKSERNDCKQKESTLALTMEVDIPWHRYLAYNVLL